VGYVLTFEGDDERFYMDFNFAVWRMSIVSKHAAKDGACVQVAKEQTVERITHFCWYSGNLTLSKQTRRLEFWRVFYLPISDDIKTVIIFKLHTFY
jgi:hypothetical protein